MIFISWFLIHIIGGANEIKCVRENLHAHCYVRIYELENLKGL